MNSKISFDQLKAALQRSGFESPDDPDVELAAYGMDSLQIAISVLELEREFGLKLQIKTSLKDAFQSLRTLQKWLESQGHL